MKATALAAISALLLLVACTDRYSTESLSDDQIRITADLQEIYVPTKATFQTDLNQKNNRMKVYGYKTGTTTQHFSSPAMYRDGNWGFYNGNVFGIRYYWPGAGASNGLDFFAYFPEPLSVENKYNTHVTVSDTPCTTAKQFNFSCSDFPVTSTNQDSAVEFVCAYKEAAVQPELTESNTNKHAAVGLTFKHPFARVSFKLTEAIRSTIKTVTLTNIYNNGDCTVSSSGISWTPTGDRTSLVAAVNKKYPDDINNGGIMGGPYLIMPQEISDAEETRVQLIVEYNTTTVSVDLNKASGVTKWEPGKDYTYALTLNGAANEVILSVSVNAWTAEGSSETSVK